MSAFKWHLVFSVQIGNVDKSQQEFVHATNYGFMSVLLEAQNMLYLNDCGIENSKSGNSLINALTFYCPPLQLRDLDGEPKAFRQRVRKS